MFVRVHVCIHMCLHACSFFFFSDLKLECSGILVVFRLVSVVMFVSVAQTSIVSRDDEFIHPQTDLFQSTSSPELSRPRCEALMTRCSNSCTFLLFQGGDLCGV